MKEGHETWRWFWKGQIQELKSQDAQKNTWRQQLRGNRRRNNRYQTMNQASTEQSPDHAKLEDLAPRPMRTWSTPSQQIDPSDYKCSTWSQPCTKQCWHAKSTDLPWNSSARDSTFHSHQVSEFQTDAETIKQSLWQEVQATNKYQNVNKKNLQKEAMVAKICSAWRRWSY